MPRSNINTGLSLHRSRRVIYIFKGLLHIEVQGKTSVTMRSAFNRGGILWQPVGAAERTQGRRPPPEA